jgi:hypothetical protein
MSPDAGRFLIISTAGREDTSGAITVVLNWMAGCGDRLLRLRP